VFDVDERVFNYLEDPKRAIELKDQLKEEYRRASVALMRWENNVDHTHNEWLWICMCAKLIAYYLNLGINIIMKKTGMKWDLRLSKAVGMGTVDTRLILHPQLAMPYERLLCQWLIRPSQWTKSQVWPVPLVMCHLQGASMWQNHHPRNPGRAHLRLPGALVFFIQSLLVPQWVN
jgi:hypothetical protein